MMKFFTITFLFLFSFLVSFSESVTPEISATLHNELNNIHSDFSFEQNSGQLKDMNGSPVPYVFFKTETEGLQIYITQKGLTYVFNQKKKSETNFQNPDFVSLKNKNEILQLFRIDADLQGTSIKRDNIEYLELSGTDYKNYFNGNNRNGILSVHDFKKIRIKNIYPGINWLLYFTDKGLKYDFEISANVSPEQIKILYRGAKEIELNEDGSLNIKCALGNLSEQTPVSFQEGNKIETKFSITNHSLIGFELKNYDPAKVLIIDPQLIWSTHFGGGQTDAINSIQTDASGNLFVVGSTNSLDFPVMNAGTYFDNSLGSQDVFITKFNSAYHLQWSTFYGGASNDEASSVSIDANGNIFVAGNSSSADFPCMNGGGYFDDVLNGNSDEFLLKFSNGGTRIFATLIGGGSYDYANDIDIDLNGNIIMIGNTQSADFPMQAGGYADNSLGGISDGVILKFDNTGILNWSTYFGGTAEEYCNSIAVDNIGNIFITGTTGSANFPLQNNGTYFDGVLGSKDLFVSKFTSSNSLVWSTFYGGSQIDNGMAIDIDNAGNAIVAGNTHSSDFPTYATGAAYIDNSLNVSSNTDIDICILKFSNTGVRLWATFFGGNLSDDFSGFNSPDYNDALKADNCGNFYLSFYTTSKDITLLNSGCSEFLDDNLSSNEDLFFTKFSKNCELKWATYFGGESNTEYGSTLTLDSKSNLIAAGSRSGNFGFPFIQYNTAYFDNTASTNNIDGFILKFRNPIFDAGVNYSLCSGGCTGNATVTVSDECSSAYAYLWSNGVTTTSASSLCAGAYSVTVTDQNSCAVDTLNFNLTNGIQISPTVNPWSCSLACSGSASVTVPGVSSPTYLWSNGSNTSSVSGLCPGNYSVTVTAPGCGSDVASFSIVVPPPLQLIVNAQTDPTSSCSAPCDATAQVLVTGGATGATVVWSNGDTGTSADSLCPGTSYTVSASDSACYTAQVTVVTPPAPVFTANVTGTSACGCDAHATVTGSNATPPFTYLWSTGETTATINSLCAGTYTVTVTDIPCGTATATIIISPNPISILQIDPVTSNCPNSCDGEAYAYISGGAVQPVTYEWSNGSNTFGAFNLCMDSTYYVTVTDACGNSDVDSITITATYDSLVAAVQSLISTCLGTCNGSAQVSASGGQSPYTYLWNSGNTTNIEYNLCAGSTYYLTVTDACSDTITFPYIFPAAAGVQVTIASNPSCANACNGSATANLTGGIPPFLFTWSTGQNGSIASNLCNDSTYSVTVTDACLSQDTISTVILLALPGTSSINMGSTACPATCDGTAEVISVGGTPPYIYYWSNGENTSSVSDLCPDSSYSVIVLDPGCSVDTFNINIPSVSMNASLTNINNSSCFSPCNGTGTVVVSGGILPYTYLWSNGQTTATLTGLCAGTYAVTVLGNGCSLDTVSFSITGPNPINITFSPPDTLLCSNTCVAQAGVTVTGGSPPFNYEWSSGEITPTALSLCSGNQYVIVTDPGCSIDSIPFYVNALSNTIVSSTGNFNTACFDTCDASASVSASDGIGSYTYLWNSGVTDSTAQNLCAGSYQVSITDSLGCVVIETILISEPPPISDNQIITDSHCENADGSIFTSGANGVAPYTYLWSTGETTQTIANLVSGKYFITITDNNNCKTIDTITVTPQYPQLQVSNDTTIILGNSVNLSVSGASVYHWTPDYNIVCDTCDFTIVSPTYTTTYCVTGIDPFGCADTACEIIVVSHECGEIQLPSAFTPNNDGHDDQFRVLGRCILSAHLLIFNRWGQLVFESNDKNVGWNGKFNGEECEVGVYSFYIESTNLLGETFKRKGNVTLLR